MIPYPNINPVALKVGPIEIHWYGIMYVIGFAVAWFLGNYRAKKPNAPFTKEQVADIIFYGALGTILGGRIGYVLFYNLSIYMAHPWQIFAVWDGGMSFHGGLLGVITALFIYSYKINKPFFAIMDYVAPLVPIGLGAGRIGNFINGELWGRVTDAPWAVVFPGAGHLPRHPSQIYEFLLEGVLLFIILWFYSNKPRPRMAVSGLFLLCYGCFRFFAEFFRQPDLQLGFIAFSWMTRGQELSIPMIFFGLVFLIWAYIRKEG